MSLARTALRRAADVVRASRAEVLIVSDAAVWALDDQAFGIRRALAGRSSIAVVSSVPPLFRGPVIHFLNRYAALEGQALARAARRHRVIVTWTHGGAYPNAPQELAGVIDTMRQVAYVADLVHVSASMYVPVVRELGVPEERIRLVPFGIDVARFEAVMSRAEARRLFGVPEDAMCIGSFQRDGEDRPKLIKGPDVFVEMMDRLARQYPSVVALLSGPARGYVRARLGGLGIPYRYVGVVRPDHLPSLYRACDVYAVTSREEGGPLGLLEAMASAVPVVSTRVGMAPDAIVDGTTGLLVDVEDVDGLAAACSRILDDSACAKALASAGRSAVRAYDWGEVGPRYAAMYEELGGSS